VSPVEIVLLGTGSPLPDPHRAGPCTLVKAGDTQLLVDAGRGCVMRLAAVGSLPVLLGGVLVTHLHSDHLSALNDVITTHWIMTGAPTPLPIWGPPGIAAFVEHTLAALAFDVAYRIAHHDDLDWEPVVAVTEVEPGARFEVGDVEVAVERTAHQPVEPSIGYRVTHDGVVAALAGDTVPCEGLDRLCADADVYVQTVIRDDVVRTIPAPRMQDILDYHSSVTDAARTAARNRVARLVLTHMVPAPPPAAVDPSGYEAWRAVAAEHFDGEIVIGDDLTTVTV
jgi:ribonuclease Z